jgi:NAD+ kinase
VTQRPGPDTPKAVGIVVHGGRPRACANASDAARRFAATGAQVVGIRGEAWDEGHAELRAPAEFGSGLDVVVVFGGDGTFLRAAYLARDQGVPLLGVNLGRLGFLSELEVVDVPTMVERVVAGDYLVEERMTLAVEVRDADGELVGSSWALNEASVERTVPQRLVVLEIRVGERVFANLPADGFICATPTGSTAYAFSAGGPILSPLVDAIVVVPVAPHALFNRTIVVDPRETVTLRATGGQNSCVVTCDGRDSLAVPPGGTVRVVRGDAPVRMARLTPYDFYGRVRQKFGLP